MSILKNKNKFNFYAFLEDEQIKMVISNNIYLKNFIFLIIKSLNNIVIDYENMDIWLLDFQKNNKVSITNVENNELETIDSNLKKFLDYLKNNKKYDSQMKIFKEKIILDRHYHNMQKIFEITFSLSYIASDFVSYFNNSDPNSQNNPQHKAILYKRKNTKKFKRKYSTKNKN